LIDVFTAASDPDVREEVHKEFFKVETKLIVLIDQQQLILHTWAINYGTPSALEELILIINFSTN